MFRPHASTRSLVQALTDRREDGPYAHLPLADWNVHAAARDTTVLEAVIAPTGPTGINLRLWGRPGEAAERYGRLLARLWPGSLDNDCDPKPGLLLTVERSDTSMTVTGPSWIEPSATVEATLRGVDMAASGPLIAGAHRFECVQVAANWEQDHAAGVTR
ncbi:hypothetical protein [Glycomyces sp. YM15]|uniref:hypothetical protein n=1 Tax=Glycomyces sp. YM15 TaxID=2800446 RepID=UPI0019662052|nr:hypothetical protein [Glycomyces sp. YM15]